MSLPDYDSITKQLDVHRCRGIRPNGQRCYFNHDGMIAAGEVHWADRKPTRSGIRRFLHLAAYLQVDDLPDGHWMRYYFAQRIVVGWLKRLRIEMPRAITVTYKAELRAMILRNPPGKMADTTIREEALAWTRS